VTPLAGGPRRAAGQPENSLYEKEFDMSKKPLGVHSEAGKLHKVMVCSPGLAHLRLTPANCDELLFDDVIWVSQAKRDHFDFMTKMRERGIEVVEMHNLLEETVSDPHAL